MGTGKGHCDRSSDKPLRVDHITVHAGRLTLLVTCAPEWSMTTPEIARRICLLRPNLLQHACINEKGPLFSAVIDRTPMPHLFEHVVVDVLVEQSSSVDATFVGTSEWLDRAAGTARVEVSFTDDLEALAAVKEAESIFELLQST